MNLVIGISIATLIGTNILTRVANTVVQQSINTIVFIHSGAKSKEKIVDTNKKIEELDIKIKIKMLKKVLDKYGDPDYRNVFEDPEDICKDIEVMLLTCSNLIQDIEQTIELHNMKWFRKYRKFDVSDLLIELERSNSIMKNRLDLFLLESNM